MSSVAASSRSIAVPGGPRSCSNSRAIRLLLLRMAGLSTMESTSATSSGSPIRSGSRPVGRRIVVSATPNSPPIETTTPVRTALNLVEVNGRLTRVATMALMRIKPRSMADTVPMPLNSVLTSRSMPTEMKKMPSRMSRKGRITASI